MGTIFNAKAVLQRKIAWLLLASLFSLCFVGWLIYSNKQKIESTTYWIEHTYSVIQHIDRLDARVAAWENLSRPAANEAFYADLKKDLTQVEELTHDNAAQQQSVARLSAVIDSLASGSGDRSLSALRPMITEIMQREKDLLFERRRLSQVQDARSNWLLIAGSLLVFLLIFSILLRLNRDIMLRRQAEQQLRQSQTWLQSIVDNSTSLIYIKEPSGHYVMVNRRFREVMGVKEEKVIGHTLDHFRGTKTASHYRELDNQVVRTRQSIESEEVIPTRNGEMHVLSVKFPLLDSNGRLIGIGGIATDITERAHYQERLIEATREAQNAKSMQELFLANMSHEIRTPMNGIQGMADLLLDTSLNDQQMEFARVIKRSVNNLLVVVNDVLDFSKIKAGKLAIEKIDFRLKDVLDNAKAMFAQRIESRGLDLTVEIDPAIPEMLVGDPYRLNQVLINLVGNAIKFTEKGWIRIRVDLEERIVSQVSLRFTIADSGIGIPEASLPYIFDNFSQAGLDISRRFGGTGLGLSICQQLLKLQGGDIQVRSRENEGTTFDFRIGYGYAKTDAQTAAAAVLADNSRTLAGRRFLVAEDNEVNRLLIDHVLRKGGGEVVLVGNGKEAVDLLRTGEQVDLVIMDLQMPVMDGYTATRHIRQELRLPVPIIAMTANALVDEQLRCLEAGMNDYMTKPFEFAELYKRIKLLLTPCLQLAE